MPMSKGILIVMTNPPADMEEEFNAWYDREHMPERLAVPGFERAQRYYLTHAERRYLALYDAQAFDVFETPAYLATSGDNNTAWTKRIVSRCNFIRAPAVQVYPGDALTDRAPRLLMLRFAEAAAQLDDIVAASRSSFAAPPVQQLRVFSAPETGDVYVLAEGHLGLEEVVRSDLYGDAARRIDLVNLYVRC
jgi:hypothetical protein